MSKIAIGYILGVVALAVCLFIAFELVPDPLTEELPLDTAGWINLLVCIFGGVSGWILGILITPKNRAETAEFEKLGSAVATFLGGFVLAKAETLFSVGVESGTVFSTLFAARVALFGTTFALGALFVFIGRKYWIER